MPSFSTCTIVSSVWIIDWTRNRCFMCLYSGFSQLWIHWITQLAMVTLLSSTPYLAQIFSCRARGIPSTYLLTAQIPEPVVKVFLGDTMLLTKLPFCQSTVVTFLNEHCPDRLPVFIPHCQYVCHLMVPL